MKFYTLWYRYDEHYTSAHASLIGAMSEVDQPWIGPFYYQNGEYRVVEGDWSEWRSGDGAWTITEEELKP